MTKPEEKAGQRKTEQENEIRRVKQNIEIRSKSEKKKNLEWRMDHGGI